jgi:hypothetical protein
MGKGAWMGSMGATGGAGAAVVEGDTFATAAPVAVVAPGLAVPAQPPSVSMTVSAHAGANAAPRRPGADRRAESWSRTVIIRIGLLWLVSRLILRAEAGACATWLSRSDDAQTPTGVASRMGVVCRGSIFALWLAAGVVRCGGGAKGPSVTPDGAGAGGGGALDAAADAPDDPRGDTSDDAPFDAVGSLDAPSGPFVIIQEDTVGFDAVDGKIYPRQGSTSITGYTGTGFADGDPGLGKTMSWSVQAVQGVDGNVTSSRLSGCAPAGSGMSSTSTF